VIDLEGGLDACIPTTEECLYIYFQSTMTTFRTHPLQAVESRSPPDQGRHACCVLRTGLQPVGLMAGVILKKLGMPGSATWSVFVSVVRERCLTRHLRAIWFAGLEPPSMRAS